MIIYKWRKRDIQCAYKSGTAKQENMHIDEEPKVGLKEERTEKEGTDGDSKEGESYGKDSNEAKSQGSDLETCAFHSQVAVHHDYTWCCVHAGIQISADGRSDYGISGFQPLQQPDVYKRQGKNSSAMRSGRT